MSTAPIRCPVCGNTLVDGVCPITGRVPPDVPDPLTLDAERIDVDVLYRMAHALAPAQEEKAEE